MQAQGTVSATAIGTELQRLSGHAASIFVGQIVSIERKGSIVEVGFRVEQPVRGSVGCSYTMREWAGLWPAGHVRYTIGQRVLAFVNGTSAAGFSSPVHGAEGLVPVVVQGAHAPQLLDVRRVAASVVRTVGTALPTEANGAVPLSEAFAWISGPATGSGAGRGLLPVPTRGRKPVMIQGTGAAEPTAAPVGTSDEPQPEPIEGPQRPRLVVAAKGVSHGRL